MERKTENTSDKNYIRESQISFLTTCMEQHLEHLRHIENERISFTSMYMALVAGVYAFIFSEDNNKLVMVLLLFGLIFLGSIVLYLLFKWKWAFNHHRKSMIKDYELLRKHLFNYEDGCVDCEEKICMTLKENFPFYEINIKSEEKDSEKLSLIQKILKTSNLLIIFQIVMLAIIMTTIYYIFIR